MFVMAFVLFGFLAVARNLVEQSTPDDIVETTATKTGSGALKNKNFFVALTHQLPNNSDEIEWRQVKIAASWLASETCVMVVDMWNAHWCPDMHRRTEAMIPLMNQTISELRERGVKIVFAPIETEIYYRKHVALKRVKSMIPLGEKALHKHTLRRRSEHLGIPVQGPLSSGCNTERNQTFRGIKGQYPWSRQHSGLTIFESDYILTDGWNVNEFRALVKRVKLKNIIYMGVATNMCLMFRPFGIVYATRLGFAKEKMTVCRELTDVIYSTKNKPYVSVPQAKKLQLNFIEKYWATTTSVTDLLDSKLV